MKKCFVHTDRNCKLRDAHIWNVRYRYDLTELDSHKYKHFLPLYQCPKPADVSDGKEKGIDESINPFSQIPSTLIPQPFINQQGDGPPSFLPTSHAEWEHSVPAMLANIS